MGMCSHEHDSADDPLFTVSCHASADGRQLSVIIEECPELTDGQTAVIARHLGTALLRMAIAAQMAQQEAN
jgi:hypothetical protein